MVARRAAIASRPTLDHDVAGLFCQWRVDRTAAAAEVSPHDELFALGRCAAPVHAAWLAEDGVRCRDGGDRWMLLFGAEGGSLGSACAQALRAARRIEAGAIALIDRLRHALGLLAEFSISLHAGAAVVGPPGVGDARVVPAAGTTLRAAKALRPEAQR